MAQMDLYVDVASGEFVTGPSNYTPAPLPRFTQGDTPFIRIWMLTRNTTYPASNPFTIMNIAGLSLKVALGPKTGTAGSALYTQQFTWAADGQNQYFSAYFPLNTSAISDLIGDAERAIAWFEIEYTQAGFPTTVLSKQVTIEAEVIETGSIVVPEGATAMTAEDAQAAFLGKVNSGFTLVSPDGSKKLFCYVDNAGAFHTDPIN